MLESINPHLQLEFKNLIINNIIPKLMPNVESAVADGPNIGIIINLISDYLPIRLSNFDSTIKEIYILYIFSYLLKDSNNNLNMTEAVYLDKIYYPNLIYLLAYFLKKASRFFQNIIRSIYNDSKHKLEKILLFYITFYNSEFIVLKNDIINIFLNNMIFDMNPLELNHDYKKYYISVFQYIFYLYLDKQSSGIIDQEVELISDQDDNPLSSSRYNIYKNGIRRTQIVMMCNESATLKKIYFNFNKVKNDIISNELQKLYTVIVDKNNILDNKMLILKFNSEDENLLAISKQYPLIYKLLRSVKIKSDIVKYSHYDRAIIKDSLKSSIYLKLVKYINEEHAAILAEAISLRLEQSITEGTYLDPYTLTTLEVKGAMFLKQLSLFINMILDHIDTVDSNFPLIMDEYSN
jgi:hypothetical protein